MIRAAVIGVGSIGRHHARIYNELEGVELAGVVDLDETRRLAVAHRYKVPAYPDLVSLLEREKVDVLSIAVPTQAHFDTADYAIQRGIHVLVEKPFTSTVEQARKLIQLAEKNGVVLTVGHVERFNPAINALRQHLMKGELGHIFQLYARRLSPFPPYIHDVGVVMDLATHELDMMNYLGCGPVNHLLAETEKNVNTQFEDMLMGILSFQNGISGVLDINWLTPTKVRELRITGERGMFVVDYLNQALTLYRNSQTEMQWDALALFKGVGEGDILKFQVQKMEPLQVELDSFIKAVINQSTPVVTGQDGLKALALAHLLLASSADGRIIQVQEEVRKRGWNEMVEKGLPNQWDSQKLTLVF